MVMTQLEMHQLLKLPILIEHFQEHQQRNRGITVAAFLNEHYLGHTVLDNDDQRDMQLPFKKTDCVTVLAFVFEAPVAFKIEHELPFVETSFVICNHNHLTSITLDAVFQPPKFA